MIETYFDKYPGHIFSINITEDVKIIHFWMKNGWTIPAGLNPNIGIQEHAERFNTKNEDQHYCIIYDNTPLPEEGQPAVPGLSFDDIFNGIVTIFEHNIEREKKEELLRIKIAQLQETFANQPLDALERMDFK